MFGLVNNSRFDEPGTFTLKLYNDKTDEFLGSFSIEVTDEKPGTSKYLDKVTVAYANSDFNDFKTQKESLSYKDTVHVGILIEGAVPGEKIEYYLIAVPPNGFKVNIIQEGVIKEDGTCSIGLNVDRGDFTQEKGKLIMMVYDRNTYDYLGGIAVDITE